MTDPIARGRAVIAAEPSFDAIHLGRQLAEDISQRFLAHIRQRSKPTSRPTNRASSLGDPCLRRLVYWRTAGEQAADTTDTSLAIFNTGNLLEGPIRRMVEEMGFEVERSQMSFPRNEYNVSGHVDGFIKSRSMPVLFVLEIKTLNGNTWKQLSSYQDIAEHAKSWVSKYAAQGQIYATLAEIERWGEELPVVGILYVLFNKWTGELKAIPAPLDYKHAGELLDKAKMIEQHVQAKTLPDFIEDTEECRGCPFFQRVCFPPVRFEGATVLVIEDPDVLEALETIHSKETAAKEYKAAKEYLFEDGGRLRGVELALVPRQGEGAGHFEVRGKWSPNTTYKVPEAIREPYKKMDPKGKWLKTIDVVADEQRREEQS